MPLFSFRPLETALVTGFMAVFMLVLGVLRGDWWYFAFVMGLAVVCAGAIYWHLKWRRSLEDNLREMEGIDSDGLEKKYSYARWGKQMLGVIVVVLVWFIAHELWGVPIIGRTGVVD